MCHAHKTDSTLGSQCLGQGADSVTWLSGAGGGGVGHVVSRAAFEISQQVQRTCRWQGELELDEVGADPTLDW